MLLPKNNPWVTKGFPSNSQKMFKMFIKLRETLRKTWKYFKANYPTFVFHVEENKMGQELRWVKVEFITWIKNW